MNWLYYNLIVQVGSKAPHAAGRIHTDFERGFIMAEVMGYNDFKEFGSEAECKVQDNVIYGLIEWLKCFMLAFLCNNVKSILLGKRK